MDAVARTRSLGRRVFISVGESEKERERELQRSAERKVGWINYFVPAAGVSGGLVSNSFGATTEQGDSPFSGLRQRAA